MFQNAYGRLENIVMPILTAWLTSEGRVAWNMGAGLIVNEYGDFITAAHILKCINRPMVREIHWVLTPLSLVQQKQYSMEDTYMKKLILDGEN